MASEASSLWPIPATADRRSTRRLNAICAAIAWAFVVWFSVSVFAPRAISQDEVSGVVADGDEAKAEEEAEHPLEYVTVLCPDDRQAEWRPDDHRLVAPSEFSAMLRRAHPGSPPAIRSAHYEARFDRDELVEGRALLAIEHLGPLEATLPLNPCNLAIERAGWADRDGEAARVGLGPSGNFALHVDHGGMLDIAWSRKGMPGTREAVSFDMELPSCPSSRFLLTLPEDRVPLPSTGVLSRRQTSLKGMHRWQIELGGQNRFTLRIVADDNLEGHGQFTELRQASLYRLSSGGLDATITLRFDVLDQPLKRLELLVSSELVLGSVQDGDNAIDWGEEPLAGTPTKKKVVIEPEIPIHGLGRELVLTALAPVRMGVPWRLPGVTVTGVRWCESVASLVVQHPLRLNDVTSDKGRIAKVRSLLSRTASDAVDLQLFSPDAQIDIVLGQEQTPPQIAYGVKIEMSGGQIAGRQVVRLETTEGEHFQVVGNLARSWVVDAVQAEPPGVLADWRIERKGRAKRQLMIDLARPLSSDAPVQLVLAARRLESTEGRRYLSRDMIPVEFVSCQLDTALVALHAFEPYQIELSGAEGLVQREAQDLSVQERQLFLETPRGTIYSHGGGDEGLGIRVKQRRSLYSAEIDVDVSVSGSQATESYVFRIHPESVRLENLAVEVLKRPGSPLRWEPTTGDEIHLDVASSNVGLPAGDPSRLERWNVRLRPSRSEPFEIRAKRVFAVKDETAIALARLPDAAQQKGRLVIGLSGGGGVRVENRSLTSEISPPLRGAHDIPQSVFRYDPRRSLVSGRPPIVLRVESSPSPLPEAWIWQCELESRLEPTGNGQHIACYRVESVGAPTMELSLPASIGVEMVESVEVDGRRAPLESTALEAPAKLAVRLDGDRRFHEVTVCYRTTGSRWSALQPLRVPVPEPDLPILKRKWIVWLPPGRQLIEPEGRGQDSHASGLWPASIWGPMGGDTSRGPLDPFAADSWRLSNLIESARHLAPSTSSDGQSVGSLPASWGNF